MTPVLDYYRKNGKCFWCKKLFVHKNPEDVVCPGCTEEFTDFKVAILNFFPGREFTEEEMLDKMQEIELKKYFI